MFVLDASVAAAWLFPDEVTALTERALDLLRAEGAIVPLIWPLEMSNLLLVAERRERITRPQASHFLEFLGELPIAADEADSLRLIEPCTRLGRLYRLSAYDASYLDLALRAGTSLATADDHLRRAAIDAGVGLVS